MTTDVEALLLRIEASSSKLERDMAKIGGKFDSSARRLEARAKALSTTIASGMSSGLGRIGALVGAAFTVDRVVEASQAYLRASNALKVAGLSGDDLKKTFDDLYRIAQANGAPIETLVGLYSKASQAQKSLGASSADILRFTTATAEALRVSGKSAEEASGALLQLGQAISGTNVQAEEYNSLIDGAYPLLQAAAAGIREAGGDVAKLTTLVKDGQVSSKAFFYGVLAGAPTLTEKLAGSTETLAQAWTKFQNALIKTIGTVDESTGATRGLTSVLDDLSKGLDSNAAAIARWATELKNNVIGAVGPVAGAIKSLHGAMLGLENAGLDAVQDLPQDVIDAFPEYKAMGLKSRQTGAGAKSSREPMRPTTGDADARVAAAFSVFESKPVKTVSLADYPAESKKKGGGGSDALDEYEREVRAIEEKTAALKVEAETVGMSTEAQAKALEVQKLKTAAARAEQELTPERLAQIEEIASAYAKEVAELERLKKANDDATRAGEHLGEAAVDALSDIIIEGRNAGEVMQNLAKSLAKAVLQSLLLGSGPLGGLLGGGIFKGLFSFGGGGATGAPLKITPFATGGVVTRPTVAMAGEAGPEAFIPLSGGRIPVRLSLPSAASLAPRAASQVAVTFSPAIDARGASVEAVARLDRTVAELARTIPKQVEAVIRRREVRGVHA